MTLDRAVYREAEIFVSTMLRQFTSTTLDELPDLQPASPLTPIRVQNLAKLSAGEKAEVRAEFFSTTGVAYFVAEGLENIVTAEHPIFAMARQLKDDLPFRFPIPHPLERSARLVDTFGRLDGTVKVYDVRKQEEGYREQGETSEAFLLHHDGLGSAGAVELVTLYTDSSAFWGGFTYFFNVCRIALELARRDYHAFVSLFMPNAMNITRPRGKGAIRVTSPVLYLNEDDEPQSSYRLPSGEYTVELLSTVPELHRAMYEMQHLLTPFGHGCAFVNFSQANHGCLIRNAQIAHGRTPFGDSTSHRRVLARKWYGRQESDIIYKHVPAIRVNARFAAAYPEMFAAEQLEGEWLLNSAGENARMR